jgi:hypothetical protein
VKSDRDSSSSDARPADSVAEEQKEGSERRRHTLSPRDVWRLILASYRGTLPYLLIFIAGLLLATWILTELAF